MIIETRRFGEIEISEEQDIIQMVGGLPGFEDAKKFILLNHDADSLFKWLQAVENPELAFVVMEPFIFCPDYHFDLSDDELAELELTKPEEVVVLAVLSVPEDPKKITANIKAPIVINRTKRRGKQIILNNEAYPVKYYLFLQEERCQGGR